MKLDEIGKPNGELKPKQEWDKVDNEGNEMSVQVLFSIFNGVSLDKFHKITTWKCEKSLNHAWGHFSCEVIQNTNVHCQIWEHKNARSWNFF